MSSPLVAAIAAKAAEHRAAGMGKLAAFKACRRWYARQDEAAQAVLTRMEQEARDEAEAERQARADARSARDTERMEQRSA